jgi:hypothetical protein
MTRFVFVAGMAVNPDALITRSLKGCEYGELKLNHICSSSVSVFIPVFIFIRVSLLFTFSIL